MDPQNLTHVSDFFLLGLAEDPREQPFLFGMFLSMYLVTMMGNLLIILAVICDPHLHTPMYFFLSHLSLADIGFTSTTVPKVLLDTYTHRRDISYVGCLIQLSFLYFFACLDSVLLMVMAYDRFVAICHPLHYPVIMNSRLCGLLFLVSIFISLFDSQLHCVMVSQLTFCIDVEIPSFFCDPPQLFNVACSDTFTNTMFMYSVGTVFGGIPVSGILFSYVRIVASVLKVPSSRGRQKAFFTCGSHLLVVCLFYGTAAGVYLSSAVSPSVRKGAVASVMFTVVTPMLNPFIYSLRNTDIKRALKRLLGRIS